MSDYDNVIEVDFEDDDDFYEDYEFYDELEDDDDDYFEDDDDGESIERKRRRSRRRSKPTRFYKRKTQKGYVTQPQLKSALNRVSKYVKRVDGKANGISRSVSTLRRKTGSEIKSLKKGVENNKQMFMLTSLLGGDKTMEIESITDASGNRTATIDVGTKIQFKDASSSTDKLLPLMMMGGFGGSSSSGGMMDNPLMMILMLDALDK